MLKTIYISILLFSFVHTAHAANEHHHNHGHNDDQFGWSAHIDTRTYITDIYNAEENTEEISDIFSHSHANIRYQFNETLSINSSLTLEGDPAGHAHGGGNVRTGNRFSMIIHFL